MPIAQYRSEVMSYPNTAKSKESALLALMDKTGYNIIQENGQRKFGPPPDWTGPMPKKGSEVFVGKLPRDLYEDEIIPVFERVGKIYEIRLMMDFSGTNRGYAFVMYTEPQFAKEAVRQLDNFEIRKGKFIGVCKSVDNCRLFVGGIPKSKGRDEILTEMNKVTDGVVDVILYSSVTDKTKNRGFAFVEYENHRSAAMARRKLIPGKIQLWGHDIAVDWAEPEPEIPEDIMSAVTILYVRNLTLTTTEDQIRDVFSLEERLKVEKVKKLRDFAFVHYHSREDAQMALKTLNDQVLDGAILEVMWAKPVDRGGFKKGIRGSMPPVVSTYAPVMYTSPGFDMFGYGTSYPYAASSMAPGSVMMPRIAIRGRTRGAAGLRGGRGSQGYGYRKATEHRFITFQPTMELFPTNPYTLKPARSSYQILNEYCQKNSLGEPHFSLHSTLQTDNVGDNTQLFVYKVQIPGLAHQFNQFQPPKLCHHVEEAKQYAAEYVLGQLGVPIESPDSALGSVHVATGGGASVPHYSAGRMGPLGYLAPTGSSNYTERESENARLLSPSPPLEMLFSQLNTRTKSIFT